MWYFESKDVISIHFEISNYCNASCPECPRADPHEIDPNTGKNRFEPMGWIDTHFLSLDLIKKRINADTLPNLQDVYFCGCFGDACTHPKLIEIIEYLTAEFPKLCFWIHTNGGLKTPRYWEKLANVLNKTAYYEVIWGIDGLADTNHLYRVGVNWNKLQENFRAFNNAGGNSVWQFILFPHNYHQLDEVRATAKKEKFFEFKKVLSFRYADERNMPEEFKHAITKDNILEVEDGDMSQRVVPPKPHFDNWSKSFNTRDVNTGKLLACNSQQQHNLFVFSEGTVWPCSRLGFNGEIPLKPSKERCQSYFWEVDTNARTNNSLHTYSIEEIMKNAWWTQVLDSHKTGNMCRSCVQECGKMIEDKELYETKDINFHERL